MLDSLLNGLTSLSLLICDPLLGWLLALPSDLTLFGVSLITAGLFTLFRALLVKQDRMRRANQDTRRLNQLLREAKQAKDKAAVQRYRNNKNVVGLLKLRLQGWFLLVALVVLGLLGIWAFIRLDLHAPKENEPVEIVLSASATADECIPAVLVPSEPLQLKSDAVQPLVPSENGSKRREAVWTVSAPASPKPYLLTFRLGDKSCQRELLVGQRFYSEPILDHEDEIQTTLRLRQVKLFGILPGWNYILLPPWLVAYLVIAVPAILLLKRVCKLE